MNHYLINPLDPLIFGTGRPFSTVPGSRLDSAPLPPPSTVAGLVRTEAGRGANGAFDAKLLPELLKLHVRGPFPAILDAEGHASLAFAAPADHVRLADEVPKDPAKPTHTIVRTVPIRLPDGAVVSDADSAPVAMIQPRRDKPAANAPELWSWPELRSWLIQPPDSRSVSAEWGVRWPSVERRTHVSVNASFGTALDGMLFATGGRRFMVRKDGQARQPMALYVQTDATIGDRPVSLGGEGRLSAWVGTSPLWDDSVPAEVIASARAGFARAVFLTPAHFGSGSRWNPPAPAQVVAQVHGRAWTMSGFAMAEGHDKGAYDHYPNARERRATPGPKPTQRLVPAGAVYFLRLGDDPDRNESFVRSSWGRSVHEGADARDGFGIVAFGVWDGQLQTLSVSRGTK